jgi:NADH:ubiquinone oxidoreductase subunit D
MMHYIISDGTDQPYRLKIRTGSFNAMTLMEDFSPGLYIADLISFFASLDVVAPEIDR